MKKINRFKTAALLLLISIAASLLLGLLLVSVTFDPEKDFCSMLLSAVKANYFCFAAPLTVASLLIFFTKIDEVSAIKYGAGVYYGTIFCSGFLSDYVDASDETRRFIGFIIASLICRIFYLKEQISCLKQEMQ